MVLRSWQNCVLGEEEGAREVDMACSNYEKL
jgi:hypothetical protein